MNYIVNSTQVIKKETFIKNDKTDLNHILLKSIHIHQ